MPPQGRPAGDASVETTLPVATGSNHAKAPGQTAKAPCPAPASGARSEACLSRLAAHSLRREAHDDAWRVAERAESVDQIYAMQSTSTTEVPVMPAAGAIPLGTP